MLCALDGTIVAYLLRDLPVVENLGDGVPLEFECKLALVNRNSFQRSMWKTVVFREDTPKDHTEYFKGASNWLNKDSGFLVGGSIALLCQIRNCPPVDFPQLTVSVLLSSKVVL